MTKKLNVSRRDVLRRSLAVIGAGGAASLLSACGSSEDSFACTDTSGLEAADAQMRKTLEYVDKSPHSDKDCLGCQLWASGTVSDKCGGCQILKGPIHPKGYCKSWVKKA